MALLTDAQIAERLKALPGWSVDGRAIRKTFTFAGFPEAVAFVGRLVPGAEAADHHPDLQINYRRVTVSYSTHIDRMRLKKTYSSREVSALTGLTARQLQVWDASHLLSPAIPPRRTAAGGYTERRYTPIELFELLVLADLRRRGFSVPQLHALVKALKDQFGVRLFEATGGGGSIRLLTDGRDIYARTGAGAFFNLLSAPGQPMLVVGDEGTLKELGGTIRPRRRSTKHPSI
jgi:4a-hydroxytetrahydrobiopterin dehydratase